MRISGVTIAWRAVELGYPVVESIRSMLELCDEVVVNVGRSEDGTAQAILGLESPKVRLLEDPWDLGVREKGRLLSLETNRALDAATGDWAVYLQADEVLHEADLPGLHDLIRRCHEGGRADGISFRYRHFYGSPAWVQDNPFRWYRRAVRAVRREPVIRSVGDALKFRRIEAGRTSRLRVVRSSATVYHYGWARPPEVMVRKQRHLERFWRGDEEIERRFRGTDVSDIYRDTRHVVPFTGSHPAVMAAYVNAATWGFAPPARAPLPRWARLGLEALRRLGDRLRAAGLP